MLSAFVGSNPTPRIILKVQSGKAYKGKNAHYRMKKSFDKFPYGTTIKDLKKTISPKNSQYVDKFIEHLTGYVTETRLSKYHYTLVRFAYLVEKDFDKLTYEEVRKAGGIINQSNLSIKTKQDVISEIKTSFKYFFGKNQFFPEVVGGLKPPTSKGKLRLPEDMPTEKDIYRMIKACNNSRDEFFISLIALDGALRPIEARGITWGAIKKDQHSHYITIHTAKKSGDKETRVIRIIKSEPYFIRWCNEYPAEKTDEAFVFINYSDLKPLTKGTIASLFRRLKKKLGLKRMYPYLLRHGFITTASKDSNWTEPLLKKFIGHSLRSNTIAEYQHFGDEDLKDIQLKVNGIVKKDIKKEQDRKPIKCLKCGKSNEYDAEFCYFCNMALSQKRIVEINEKQESANKLLFILAKKELEKLKGKQKEELEEIIKNVES